MENLLTSMSFWGIAAVFATTSQLIWEYVRGSVRSQSKNPVTKVVTLTHKSFSFVEAHYKTLFIAGISLSILPILDSWILPQVRSVTYFTVLMGAFTYAVKCTISSWIRGNNVNKLKSFLAFILENNDPENVISLLVSTCNLLILFACYQSLLNWTPYLVFNIFVAYALGSSLIQLLFSVFNAEGIVITSSIGQRSFLISADRIEFLCGAVIAASLLGTTFIDLQAFHYQLNGLGGILLPIVLTLSGTLISIASTILIRVTSKPSSQYALFAEKLVNTLIMIIISFIVVQLFLPQVWVFGTREYSAIQVFYAAQAGLICGLLISKLIHLYEMAEKVFIEYLYLKSYHISATDKAMHNFLRVFSAVVPLILLIGAFLLAYQWVGLYGVCIAIVAMQANLRTELSSEVAALEKLVLHSRKIFSLAS